VKENLEAELGKSVRQWNVDDLISLLEAARNASQQIVQAQKEDARKEFEPKMRVGYGIDNPAAFRDEDFTAVCGTVEGDPIIQQFHSQLEQEKKTVERLIEKLKALH